MNITALDVNEGWPTKSQFYYNNSKTITNNYDMFSRDQFSKDYHYEPGNSPSMFNSPGEKEPISEGFYNQHSHLIAHSNDEYYMNERNSRNLSTNHCQNEFNFYPVDTCNSNCPLSSQQSSFITNYNLFPISTASQHSRTSSINEKKFISEIHINIKEPYPGEVEPKPILNSSAIFPNEYVSYNKIPENNNHQTGYHISSLEAFISNQNEIEIPTNFRSKISEIRSNSGSPNRKRECHHSEKFIYLGCDTQLTPQIFEENNEINSFNSQTVFEKNFERPLCLHSRNSDINDDLKSFSTKSVQTSKQIDCIFKSTCDRSMITDIIDAKPLIKEECKPTKLCNKPENPTHSTESESENQSLLSENFSEIKCEQYQINIEKPTNLKPTNPILKKIQKPNARHVAKNEFQFVDDINQDTYAGSYSESFSQSNQLDELPIKEKPVPIAKEILKNPPVKLEHKRPTIIKNNSTIINNKANYKTKQRKGFSDRKDSVKCKENNDRKQNFGNKEDTERHSLEIQCLLDNLNTHLQNTVNSHNKPTKTSSSKGQNSQFNNIGSFWDNPLNPETTRSLLMGRQITPKVSEPLRQKSINPEIQALFESLEKSHNHDKIDSPRITQKKSPSIDINIRNQKMHNISIAAENHSIRLSGDGLGSIDNLHDSRFPPNLKFQKSFDLSPYDELVKSHLNQSDRRIKSVAAKNGCRIVIDGPISLVDPTTTCQAIRNKIAYRCAIGGPSKDRLDKCLNYLKETFPNTCLRLHNRNNLGIKS